MAAAQGNQYAAKEAQWRNALKRALESRSKGEMVHALDVIAGQMVDAAMDPAEPAKDKLPIWKELADRLDGKPKQQTEVTGADGAPLLTSLAIEFVKRESTIP